MFFLERQEGYVLRLELEHANVAPLALPTEVVRRPRRVHERGDLPDGIVRIGTIDHRRARDGMKCHVRRLQSGRYQTGAPPRFSNQARLNATPQHVPRRSAKRCKNPSGTSLKHTHSCEEPRP